MDVYDTMFAQRREMRRRRITLVPIQTVLAVSYTHLTLPTSDLV